MSLRHALLGLLAQRPRHGYELHAALENLTGGDKLWEVKPAQVYTTLERLENAGQIRCLSDLGHGEEPARRIYALTPDGQSTLQEWFTGGVATEHQRDEVFLKLMTALRSGQANLQKLVQTQRATLYRELHSLTTLRQRLDPRRELAQILLLDKAIMHLEADLRWLEFAEVRLEEVRQQPVIEPVLRPRGRPRKINFGEETSLL